MTVTLALPDGLRVPFCTAIVLQSRACGAGAGPHDFSRGVCSMTTKTRTTSATRRTAQRPPARRRVVARLWHTAERQVAEIEARLEQGGDAAALERDAKTFAIIARTVRDLVALDAEAEARMTTKEKRSAHASAEPEDAATPEDFGTRDIEQFRAELARRLDALRAEREREPAS
jgi:hypothetical protein